eukprot:108644_1
MVIQETTLGNVNINWFYHFTRIVILSCFLLALFPVYHLTKHVCKASCCACNRKIADPLNPNVKHTFIQSKLILSISMFFYISYISICSFDAIAKYIDLGMNALFCEVIYTINGWLFVIAKAFLYNYFILRANDTFWDTAYQYNQCCIQLVLPLELITIFSIMYPVSHIFLYDIQYDVQSTDINGGEICILHFPGTTYSHQTIAFAIGGCIDLIFSCVAAGFLLFKLFIVIQQSSQDANYDAKIHKVNDTDPKRTMLLSEQHVDINNNECIISASDVYVFHSDTNTNNKMLLLITKLLVLLLVQMIAMIVAATLYVSTSLIFWSYVIDSCVDVYCLFLTFKFSEKYYYERFCGMRCSKCMFPCVKTIGLGYQCTYCKRGLHLDDRVFKPCCRCCGYCVCCVRCYRVKCTKQRLIYTLANKEIDLLLATSLRYKPRKDTSVWNPIVYKDDSNK